MRSGITVWIGGLVVLSVILGSPAVQACEGICWIAPHGGCHNIGGECDDPLTGCGTCRDIIPLIGPCVCDPATPATPPPSGPPPVLWLAGCTSCNGAFEIALVLGDGFYDTGSVVCATQLNSVEVEHQYNAAWLFAMPDVLHVKKTSFCVEMGQERSADPDWVEFQLTSFRGSIPSFSPNALPFLETGPNVVELAKIPSRGKVHVPTGTVVAEVHASLRNDMLMGLTVPLRAGLYGVMNPDSGTLEIQKAHLNAITPAGYQGPVPN